MRHIFKPVDHQHRAQEKLRVCTQTGCVIDYIAAFHSTVLECMDVSDTEALARYVDGLKKVLRTGSSSTTSVPYTKQPNG